MATTSLPAAGALHGVRTLPSALPALKPCTVLTLAPGRAVARGSPWRAQVRGRPPGPGVARDRVGSLILYTKGY